LPKLPINNILAFGLDKEFLEAPQSQIPLVHEEILEST